MRFRAFCLALALALLLPGAAIAQNITGTIGPGGLLYKTTAVSTVSTVAGTAVNIFSQTISSSLLASQPGHLSLHLNLTTAGTAGTLTTICSYGGISLTLMSAITPTASLTSSPVWMDFWISPIASTARGKALRAEWFYVPSGTTGVFYVARTTGTAAVGNTQTMACTANFSVATSGLVVEKAALNIGN